MRTNMINACAVVLLLAVFAAGEVQRPAGGSDERGGGGGASAGSSSVGSRGVSAGGAGTVAPTVSSRDVYSGTASRVVANTGLPSSGGGSYAPDLSRSSFVSQSLWLRSQEYFWYLQSFYGVNPYYFRRFYRNSEPLMTPQIAKLTLRQPVALSMSMLEAVEQLETLIRDRQEGKSVSQQEIATRTEQIRDLAKQIRNDQSVAFFDQRKDKDLLKGMNLNTLEALTQLREMITNLNLQLKGLYDQSQTFAVSVDSLTQPSLSSLSKGIEKLSKSIETSTRKI